MPKPGVAHTMEDFLSFIPIDDPDERVCSPWKGPLNSGGYGRFSNKLGIDFLAHRAIWEFEYGEIKNGLYVLHYCDNPPCIRVSHLWLGNDLDNVQDMIVKGRQYTGTHEGERNPKVKLTAKEVLEIRTLKDKGKRQFELAKMFGVSSSQISLIVKREAWTHI